MKNFWNNLPKPFFSLAPMYDVTDAAFRAIIAKYGKPDVSFTEFVSVSGLCSDEGRPKLLRELYYTEAERPIVAQVFGNNPDHFRQAAKLIKELSFDGIDINMGCPDRAVIKQGAGSALIKNTKLAQEIIKATKEAGLPVSVKTRIGFSKIDEMEKWIGTLLEAEPATLTVHLRTTKELSEVSAHWELADKVAKIAREAGVIISCNGDVKDLDDARAKAEKYGLDGVMLGRAVLGNPWLFANLAQNSGGETLNPQKGLASGIPTPEQKLRVMIEHTRLFEDLYGVRKGEALNLQKGLALANSKLPDWALAWYGNHPKNFAVMKKHFKAYVSGFRGASELRAKLMEAENVDEVERIVNDFLL